MTHSKLPCWTRSGERLGETDYLPMTAEFTLPPRAWLIVGLLWMAGCFNYLVRVTITALRPDPEFLSRQGVSLGQQKGP